MACLRWDFGFTCPFCLLHEADLSEHGATREGMLNVEHLARRETNPERQHDYDNAFLACRFCNSSRGRKPSTDADGRTLLDPTRAAWAAHFVWRNEKFLCPKPGDADAAYTWKTYALDDEKKVTRRQWRRESLPIYRSAVEEFPDIIAAWHREARSTRDPAQAKSALDKARNLQRQVDIAVKVLIRFSVVPADAPERCRCGDGEHALPAWLAQQSQSLSLPASPTQR